MDKVQDVIDILKAYKQEHIIEFLEILNEEEKNELIEQINKIDLHQIMELYDNTKRKVEIKEKKIEPLNYLDKEKLVKDEKERFESLGENIVKNGKYAVVTMAGGQGTRLRTPRTKRNF